jgi:hypothetical protein
MSGIFPSISFNEEPFEATSNLEQSSENLTLVDGRTLGPPLVPVDQLGMVDTQGVIFIKYSVYLDNLVFDHGIMQS